MLLQKVAAAFHKEKIQYVLVGGYAVALQGAVRGTMDVDLCLAFTEKTFIRAEEVLKGLGFLPRLPVRGVEVFQFRKDYIEKRNLIAWSFYHPKNPADVVDIIITEDARKMKADRLFIQGTPVLVASKKDLIRMKKASGRPQDLLDVEGLKKVKDGKK
jgi:hypothetical protein